MKRPVLRQSLHIAVLGWSCATLSGCAATEQVSPGARGLSADQRAWIISDDDVQLVSLNGTALQSKVTFETNQFEDGVRDQVLVEPGSHVVEVRLDNGKFAVKEPMKLRLDVEPATTYYVTVNNGPPMGYQVHAYSGQPDKALLQRWDR